jgi:hypothetical protein
LKIKEEYEASHKVFNTDTTCYPSVAFYAIPVLLWITLKADIPCVKALLTSRGLSLWPDHNKQFPNTHWVLNGKAPGMDFGDFFQIPHRWIIPLPSFLLPPLFSSTNFLENILGQD